MSLEKASAYKDMSILFDFDGTIGDTETPAMEVAFWEIAPYLVNTREFPFLVSVPSVMMNGIHSRTCDVGQLLRLFFKLEPHRAFSIRCFNFSSWTAQQTARLNSFYSSTAEQISSDSMGPSRYSHGDGGVTN